MRSSVCSRKKQQSDETVADEKWWLHVNWTDPKNPRREAEHRILVILVYFRALGSSFSSSICEELMMVSGKGQGGAT